MKSWFRPLSLRRRPIRSRRRPATGRTVSHYLYAERLEDRQLLSAAGGLLDAGAVRVASLDQNSVPNELLVQFSTEADEAARAAIRDFIGASLVESIQTEAMRWAGAGVLEVLGLPQGFSVALAAAGLESNSLVRFAEPNLVLTHQAVSNDFYYEDGQLWGMFSDDNPVAIGPVETATNGGTTNPYGTHAEEAWNAGSLGSRTVYVGVIDEGIDYRHPDLYLNIGINQTEIPSTIRANLTDVDADGLITFYDLNNSVNQGSGKITDRNGNGRIDGGDLLYSTSNGGWADGKDGAAYTTTTGVFVADDGNSLVDDLVGWDFAGGNNTTYDGSSDDHGTHVAGTIGALGGNGIGVAGMNWEVSLIPVKFLGSFGGTTANAIKAIDYITDLKVSQGLNIVATNNSWGGGGASQLLLEAIGRAAQADILFVAAAGNNGSNNDTTATYPSNYDPTTLDASNPNRSSYDNVIAVAAIGVGGGLESFSNYGATTVDLAAPGSGIWSTIPNGGYYPYSGTSMATPHVTGAAALYAAAQPGASAESIRNAILGSVITSDSLAGKTATGGRLNVSGFVAQSHDVAVTSVVATPSSILTGAIAQVEVTVRNAGTHTETFTVTLEAAGATAGGSITRTSSEFVTLLPGSVGQFTFDWETPAVTASTTYTLTATAGPVGSEVDTADNTKTTTVTVAPETHDVAVTSVVAPASVQAGESATIAVSVENRGNVPETFTVTLAADGGSITRMDGAAEPYTVTLDPGSSRSVSFAWTTPSPDKSTTYTLTATASLLPDEGATDPKTDSNASDNTRSATVTVVNGDPNDLYVADMTWASGWNRWEKYWTDVTIYVNRDADADAVGGQADPGDQRVANATVTLLLIHDSNGNGIFGDGKDKQWSGTANTLSDGTVTFTVSKGPSSGKFQAEVTSLTHSTPAYEWNRQLDGENPDWYDRGVGEYDPAARTFAVFGGPDLPAEAAPTPAAAVVRFAAVPASVQPRVANAWARQPDGSERAALAASHAAGRIRTGHGQEDEREDAVRSTPAVTPVSRAAQAAIDLSFADDLLISELLSVL